MGNLLGATTLDTAQRLEEYPAPWVLLVEDDSRLRPVIAEMLADMTGQPVRQAACGFEALRLLAGEPSAPTFAVIDLEMRRLDGEELLLAARQRHSSLPAVVMTTHPEPALQSPQNRILLKPFGVDDLRREIRSMLPRERTAPVRPIPCDITNRAIGSAWRTTEHSRRLVASAARLLAAAQLSLRFADVVMSCSAYPTQQDGV